jgi:hypothetical protein
MTDPRLPWRNPRWASTPEWARPILQSLQEFLAQPTFYGGVKLGDGTMPTKDPETGATIKPPVELVNAPRFQEALAPTPPDPDTLARLDALDDEAANLGATMAQLNADLAGALADVEALATNPIPFTRISDVLIETPHLAAGAVDTLALAAMAVTTTKLDALAVTTAKLAADAVTADKLAAVNVSVGKFIRSASYEAGTSGWAIDGDGTAEFNNITVRNAAHVGGSIAIGTVPFGFPDTGAPAFHVSPDGEVTVATPDFNARNVTFNQMGGTVQPFISGMPVGLTRRLHLRGGDHGISMEGAVNVTAGGSLAVNGTAVSLSGHTHDTSHTHGDALTLAHRNQRTTVTAAITTETVVLSITVNLASGRLFRIAFSAEHVAQTVEGDAFTIGVKNGNTGTFLASARSQGAVAWPATFFAVVAGNGLSHNYQVTLRRIAGTGSATVQASSTAPANLTIEDIGPA